MTINKCLVLIQTIAIHQYCMTATITIETYDNRHLSIKTSKNRIPKICDFLYIPRKIPLISTSRLIAKCLTQSLCAKRRRSATYRIFPPL